MKTPLPLFLAAGLIFSCPAFIFSQEAEKQEISTQDENISVENQSENTDENEKEVDAFLCKINSIQYDSRGKTKVFALERSLTVDTAKIFSSEKELSDYVDALVQQIINLRLLDDVKATYTFTGLEKDIHLAEVTVSFSDSKHILGLPKPGFDSNSGAELKLKLKDTNFLGLMNTLNFDINLNLGDKDAPTDFSRVYTGINFDYILPFNLGPLENSWSNEFAFSWNIIPDTSGNLASPDFNYATGLTVGIPFGFNNKINLTMKQSVIKNADYKKYGDELYFVEGVTASLPLTIGVIGNLTPVTYTPSVNFTYNWDADKINYDNEDLVSPKVSFTQELATEHIDWHENFRGGFSVTGEQSIGWNFGKEKVEEQFQAGLSGTVQLFHAFKYAGLASRIYFCAKMNDNFKIGQYLRGALDNQYSTVTNDYALKTPVALVFSLDIPVHIVTTNWLGWGYALFGSYQDVYNKTPSWLKWATWFTYKLFSIADFELQLSPFVDIGLNKNLSTNTILKLEDGIYCGGIEALVYPAKWKSYVVRVCVGMDVGRKLFANQINTSWRPDVSTLEVFFGLGRQF